MKDLVFAKKYEAIQPEMDVIRAIVEARTSQSMTQKDLVESTGINQADISKIEFVPKQTFQNSPGYVKLVGNLDGTRRGRC